jgi:hypothetical protein
MAKTPFVLGGLVAAAAGAALKNRKRLSGLFGGGGSTPQALPSPAQAQPGQAANEPGPAPAPPVSNADVAGPPTNTATHVPAPEPFVHEPAGGIDEAAEEAAAAAEAANIGGGIPEYPGLEHGELADEAERPLEEAGEGESEGLELAEFELADNAEPAAGDPLEGGRQIDDVIAEQDDPTSGEQFLDDQTLHGDPPTASELEAAAEGAEDDPPAGPRTPEPQPGGTLAAGTIDDGAPTTGGTLSGLANGPAGGEQPTVEQPKVEPDPDDPSEWQTWSGRATDS